jgi:hypothetical protein
MYEMIKLSQNIHIFVNLAELSSKQNLPIHLESKAEYSLKASKW